MHLNLSTVKWRPFFVDLNELMSAVSSTYGMEQKWTQTRHISWKYEMNKSRPRLDFDRNLFIDIITFSWSVSFDACDLLMVRVRYFV